MQIIHGLVDRVMEKNRIPFVSPGEKSGYYIERSDVSVYHCIGVVCVLFCPFFARKIYFVYDKLCLNSFTY